MGGAKRAPCGASVLPRTAEAALAASECEPDGQQFALANCLCAR